MRFLTAYKNAIKICAIMFIPEYLIHTCLKKKKKNDMIFWLNNGRQLKQEQNEPCKSIRGNNMHRHIFHEKVMKKKQVLFSQYHKHDLENHSSGNLQGSVNTG